jgi:hypothetical protein
MKHVLVAVIVLLGLAPLARAQEGGAPVPPPADPPPVETPEPTEPQKLEPPAPAAPEPAKKTVAPGRSGAPAFTWGDSTGMILPPLADVRTPAELDSDYALWKQQRATSESRMLKARERSVRWKSQVELQKSQVEFLGKQIDAAKKEKREADRKDAEASKKREEKKRDYYDMMRQVMEAAGDFHKAQFDFAQFRMTAIEQEKKLHKVWADGGYQSRISSESRNLEQSLLTMVKKDADLLSGLANREKALAEKSIQALKLWGQIQN